MMKRFLLLYLATGSSLFIAGCGQKSATTAPDGKMGVMSIYPKRIDRVCKGISTNMVILTLHDVFKELGSTGEISRDITYNQPVSPSNPGVGNQVGSDYHTSLDMLFPPTRVNGAKKEYSTLRIILAGSTTPGVTLSFFQSPPLPLEPGVSNSPDSWMAVQSGSKNPTIFCGLQPIQQDPVTHFPYIDIGVQGIGKHADDSLNIGLMVSGNGSSTPIIIDPKIGNDG